MTLQVCLLMLLFLKDVIHWAATVLPETEIIVSARSSILIFWNVEPFYFGKQEKDDLLDSIKMQYDKPE